MAAYYPAKPSQQQQQHTIALLKSLPHVYPCPHCAQHLSAYYDHHDPQPAVAGRDQLGLYLCEAHNEVRSMQGKRLFDCRRWRERWGGEDWDDEYGERVRCDEKEYGDVEAEGASR